MLPNDNLEKCLQLVGQMLSTWKRTRHRATFETHDQEITWQKQKKELKQLIKTLAEELNETK